MHSLFNLNVITVLLYANIYMLLLFTMIVESLLTAIFFNRKRFIFPSEIQFLSLNLSAFYKRSENDIKIIKSAFTSSRVNFIFLIFYL